MRSSAKDRSSRLNSAESATSIFIFVIPQRRLCHALKYERQEIWGNMGAEIREIRGQTGSFLMFSSRSRTVGNVPSIPTFPKSKLPDSLSGLFQYNSPMKTTELVAWIGATTGIASLIWNIYTKITANRPKLVVKAYANMIQMPPPPKNSRFLRITAQNVGTAPTTLTNVEFFEAASIWRRL